ncbi:MAG: hypothetical protein LBI72_10860 [Flavobacteriaceae bacterium]|jgi:hypothetical protein|nr:hypothetical protein [Flavobacteriaceae bacterium]
MKKVVVIFAAVMTFVACSKSDDNGKQEVDPIFSKEYFPLKDVKDLALGDYNYAGIKIGDRNVGLITTSAKCKTGDVVKVYKAMETKIDSIVYYNNKYDSKKQDCVLTFSSPRTMAPNNLIKEGILSTYIQEYDWRALTPEEKEKDKDKERVKFNRKVYDGPVEIGFQAGYLRIEDYMSDYSRVKNEKVYLYFKKR